MGVCVCEMMVTLASLARLENTDDSKNMGGDVSRW